MRRPEGVADQLRGAELHTLVDVRGREHMAEQLVERSRVTGRRALGDAAEPGAHGGEVPHTVRLRRTHPELAHPGQLRFQRVGDEVHDPRITGGDRKSTRLNSSHVKISYAVFCLKKKKQNI